MKNAKSDRQPKRLLGQMMNGAVTAFALAAMLLIGPLFVKPTSTFALMAPGLRSVGWTILLVGAVLFVCARVLKMRMQKQGVRNHGKNAPQPASQKNPSSPRATKSTLPQAMPPQSSWSEAVFEAIEWRRFEAVCEGLFAQAGFQTKAQSHGADGGVDIWLYSQHAPGPVSVVQCKHWRGKLVGVKQMREFFGVMTANQILRGTFVTSSTFSHDAQQFAQSNGINALDISRLLALIATRTADQQNALLKIAYEGEYWRPTCASCGIKMVARTPGKGGADFWGCSNYPRCKAIIPMAATNA